MNKKEKLKQYWFVIRELTGKEIRKRYSRSYLGIVWSVLNPILSMAVMSAIFSFMFHRVENFSIYLLTGNILWQAFSGATNSAMGALVVSKPLLIKVKLPMQIFPLSRVYTALVNLGYSFIAYIIFLIIYRIAPSWAMLAIIPVIFLLFLFATGIGMALSVAFVFFGDIQHLYSILLMLWMYCSAIFYPITSLSESMQKVVKENPMYCYITAARNCMMYGQWPDAGLWIRMILWAVSAFILGYVFFQHQKNNVMQKI